jgi:anti-sigma regulatory factor (Ser/Thr protein kinase)
MHAIRHGVHKVSPWFVYAALVSYPVALFFVAKKVNPIDDTATFLIKALGALAVPFGIILLQEMVELLASISDSTLRSTRQQFQIVILVLLRSFFKDFDKLNKSVLAGDWSDSTTKAVVKVIAILVMMGLMIWFKRMSNKAGVERLDALRHTSNLYKGIVMVGLSALVLVDMLAIDQTFDVLQYISLVFIGMIVVDAIFLLASFLQGHRFDDLMFDGGIVVSLIFARFPLYASNTLSVSLSIIGVAFATLCLYMLVRSPELSLLGDYDEDSVERLDLRLRNSLDELGKLESTLGDFCAQYKVPKHATLRLRLVADELLSNVIRYGFPNGGEHVIQVGFAVVDQKILMTITDDGIPFNPFNRPVPDVDAGLEDRNVGGLGIHLVRNVMDKVAYERVAGHNQVTMLKMFEQTNETKGGS